MWPKCAAGSKNSRARPNAPAAIDPSRPTRERERAIRIVYGTRSRSRRERTLVSESSARLHARVLPQKHVRALALDVRARVLSGLALLHELDLEGEPLREDGALLPKLLEAAVV